MSTTTKLHTYVIYTICMYAYMHVRVEVLTKRILRLQLLGVDMHLQTHLYDGMYKYICKWAVSMV